MPLPSCLGRIASLALLCALCGCTSFSQTYHFQSGGAGGEIPNFYRVKVEGNAQTAKARFLAGFYDERAVDLYFNEIKSTGNGELRKLFENDQKAPGEDSTIKPLTPEQGRGTFVMIFSTNPKAVADTIGNFAESQVVADALTNILNKREVEAARMLGARGAAGDLSSTALADELGALLPADAGTPASATVLERGYRRALEAISRQIGGPQSFADFDAARAWLGRTN
ncbi:hypothetical protein [Variovorax arabinosiphilus]|uniref:hypothetical protein n=1 Tax=Variovorax arabinosiphilus TaxID=3053498 RepID=UPI0025750DAF|nr:MULTISPECIES: hypothetical protein [unclassified Variovorax]MDM0122592.1 hypothetical protein [Variovorax sp. J2L1-78]MDM0130879.1 hypothetical protein [Variovorax sp. J2L1-63]MDM0235355.1 hypothetical protein [Variovorax sp. J2R1-6]